MNIFFAIFLGVIQGLTEFIPVSSTAHLLIAQKWLGLPSSTEVFAFLVIVQLGTLVSLFIYYWQDLINIASATSCFMFSFVNRNQPFSAEQKPNAMLGLYILLATIPALLAGYLLKDVVELLFQQPILQAGIRLLSAAVLLTIAEILSAKKRSLDSITWVDGFIIGLFQVIAVFPGASRSGTTISGGLLRGFTRPAAARFAFLMSVPVMLAAGGYELVKLIPLPNFENFLPFIAIGFITAAVVGWAAIRWLMSYLNKGSLKLFAIYCAVLGVLCFISYFFF